MGTPLRRHEKIIFLLITIAFITLAGYSCQKTQPANTNVSPTAVASPAQLPPWPKGFPQAMPSPVISGNIPRQVVISGSPATPQDARPFFDNFSWESFIALNWPALSGARGVPNNPNDQAIFFTAPNGTPVVWGTYKDSFDLFGQKDQRPSAWDKPSPAGPCGTTDQKTLIFITKGDTALMQTKEAFSFPLIDQRSNLVYYDIRYDEAEYNFIRGQDSDPSSWLYLLKNLAPKENAQFGVQMPMTTTSALGSIMVKAAWRLSTSSRRSQTLLCNQRADLQFADANLHALDRVACWTSHRAQSRSIHGVGVDNV